MLFTLILKDWTTISELRQEKNYVTICFRADMTYSSSTKSSSGYRSYGGSSYGNSRSSYDRRRDHDDWGNRSRKYEANFDLRDYPEENFRNAAPIVKNFYAESIITAQRPPVRI